MIKASTMHQIISLIFSKIPLSLLGKLKGQNLIVPYYHMVSDDEVLHITHLYRYKNIKYFKDDLEFLLKNYSPINLFELIESLKTARPLPDKSFLLTFDDGFREMYDVVAPILLSKGVPATFFICSGFMDNKSLCYQHKASILVENFQNKMSLGIKEKIREIFLKNNVEFGNITSGILSIKYQQKDILDKIAHLINVDFNDFLLKNKPYLTSKQIESLIKDGFTIGAHSIDHPLYSSLSLKDQLYQTLESMKSIKEIFSLNYGAFAFPHNDYNVSNKFFTEIYNSGLVDISFGTSGFKDDIIYKNFQRISLEKPLMPVERIIALKVARELVNLMMGRGKIIRKE